MQRRALIHSALIAGFAIFSMFFGSGNLVFPIVTGVYSGNHFGIATLGIALTGLLLPLLGLMSALISHKSQTNFFNQLGSRTGFIIIALILGLIGPFGVCARCTLVAFGGVKLIWPNLELWVFSLFFTSLTTFLLIRDKKAITVIGQYLTPILLAGIITVFAVSWRIPATPADLTVAPSTALYQGILSGYQTMDLMGALFFAFTIREFFAHQHKSLTYYEMRAYKFWAALLGISLLAIIYWILVFLGSKFSGALLHVPPERMIVKMSQLLLGEFAKPVVALIVLLACLTTIIVLTKLFAEFLQVRLLGSKISFNQAVIFTNIATFMVSMLGFQQLSQGLAFVLSFIYPGLMAFSVFSLMNQLTHKNWIRPGFWTILIVSVGFYFIN